MMNSIPLLDKLKLSGMIVPLDFHLAMFFTRQSTLIDGLSKTRFAFLITWLSIEVRAGHVCINVADLHKQNLEYRFGRELTDQILTDLDSPTFVNWMTLMTQVGTDMISDGSQLSPFILNANRLYFQRMWLYETHVAQYFNHSLQNSPSSDGVKQCLTSLFDEDDNAEIDWQKVATATAISRKVTIISGGPGTGKTTAISKILATLVTVHQQRLSVPLKIIASAPTGKAAARLTESLAKAIATLPVSASTKAAIPVEAITLHRLLGAKAGSNKYRYDANNPLNLDVLLIDEASMIDLPMMSSVIAALPQHARLILLGDKEQLSSVEAGAVFGDLCELLTRGYSTEHVALIKQLTGYHLDAKTDKLSIADSICLLQKSYRFDSQSGIGILANLIKEGQATKALKLLNENTYTDITLDIMNNSHQYQTAIDWCCKGYEHYLQIIKSADYDKKHILSIFSQFRLLCALREGPFGVQGLNKIIEKGLHEIGIISIKRHDPWYIGRPVMILKNSFSLGLFNGDIGITLPSDEDHHKLKVYFLLPNGEIKGFTPFRLPEHETAYAMTIHKSQGSEFEHVAIILPNEYTPLLTRSLLYTAITRAKENVTIFASTTIIEKTIHSQINRQSGLVDLLM